MARRQPPPTRTTKKVQAPQRKAPAKPKGNATTLPYKDWAIVGNRSIPKDVFVRGLLRDSENAPRPTRDSIKTPENVVRHPVTTMSIVEYDHPLHPYFVGWARQQGLDLDNPSIASYWACFRTGSAVGLRISKAIQGS